VSESFFPPFALAIVHRSLPLNPVHCLISPPPHARAHLVAVRHVSFVSLGPRKKSPAGVFPATQTISIWLPGEVPSKNSRPYECTRGYVRRLRCSVCCRDFHHTTLSTPGVYYNLTENSHARAKVKLTNDFTPSLARRSFENYPIRFTPPPPVPCSICTENVFWPERNRWVDSRELFYICRFPGHYWVRTSWFPIVVYQLSIVCTGKEFRMSHKTRSYANRYHSRIYEKQKNRSSIVATIISYANRNEYFIKILSKIYNDPGINSYETATRCTGDQSRTRFVWHEIREWIIKQRRSRSREQRLFAQSVCAADQCREVRLGFVREIVRYLHV
jgi:hypothetical protein